MELLPWDSWGLIERNDKDVTADELTFLDHVAELTQGDVPEFQAVRALYESDERLRVPPVITSYPSGSGQKIALGDEI